MSDLRTKLDSPLPGSLPAGRGSAALVLGTCFHRRRDVTGLAVIVDGATHPVAARGMPRYDLFAALHPGLGTGEDGLPETDESSDDDPELRSYRSGFWAVVPLPAAPEGRPIVVAARAELDDGSFEEVELGRIEVTSPILAPATPGDSGQIAICMATYNPDMALLRVQLDSLRAQTDADWTCVVSDDCSSPDLYREIAEELDGDERFVLSRSERRQGVYRNFERALGLIPPEAALVALCDQDDDWYPEKLARLRAGLGDAQLIFSDQRLVDVNGEVLADTYWSSRRNNHTNLTSLLIANTITGAASLMRREVVELALPFPVVPGQEFHDHWLGLVAMSLGDVAFVDEPLYDYVQHGGAALGHAAANAGPAGGLVVRLRDRLTVRNLRQMLADGPTAYFYAYVRLQVLALALLARCGERMSGAKRRALRGFVRAERSPLRIAALAARSQRVRAGRNETLGAESLLVKGILWRHALRARARGVERPAGWIYDASPPPGSATIAPPAHRHPETAQIQRIVAPLQLSVSEREPQRVNLLIPTIDLKHLFGGYIAKFNLARALAARGHRVRIVTVDPTPQLPPDWRKRVEAYSGLGGALGQIEVAFAREAPGPLPVSREDRFIATTWWSAHVARDAIRQTGRERFLYLIQEYEPFTFPMGSLSALAMQSYEFPHVALFSTELLRTFFAVEGHGVFAAGEEEGRRSSTSFQNAITPVSPPNAADLAARETRRLLFYARAEEHARRNMFELGLIALSEAIERGVFGAGWEFRGVGAVEGRSRLGLPRGAELEVLSRLDQSEYADLLTGNDVGLSLMFTPHPSLVPLEMASAGMLTVTNTYATKTAPALEAISPNLIAAEPTIEGVVAGLAEAVERVGDHEGRVAGATVDWSDNWEESLSAAVLAEIDELLERC